MTFKEGVWPKVFVIVKGKEVELELCDELDSRLQEIDKISKEITGKEIVVTAIFDGRHKVGSIHYTGHAIDLRISIYTRTQITALVSRLVKFLGKDFDVLLEVDHLHIEWDPK